MSGADPAAAHPGQPIPLRSLDDPRLAPYRDVRDADLRGAHGLYLVESAACIERWLAGIRRRRDAAAAASIVPPALEAHSLLLTPEVHARLRPAIEHAGAGPVFIAPPEAVERISGYDHHHGALAMGRRAPAAPLAALLDAAFGPTAPPAPSAGSAGRMLLVADGVVHVDNMGSLFRNAAAFGAAGVLVSEDSADPLTRKTVRISMGHVFSVPWTSASDLPAAVESLRRRGLRVLAAEDEPGALDIAEAALRGPTAVLFGAEGRGVTPALRRLADAVIRIPTQPGVPLNVAIASAIVLHEAVRAERNGGAGGPG